MNRALISAISALACAAAACAQTRDVTVTVSNPSAIDRRYEPIAISLSKVKKLGFEVKDAEVRDMATGKCLPVQIDDTDGDRKTDEIFFLADMKAGEKKQYAVSLKGAKDTDAEKKQESFIYTALQLRDKADKHPNVLRVEAPGTSNVFNDIYMHGVTIESDIVGYRIYFDHRQNIDLYGKRKKRIEIPVTQFYTTAAQLQEGYGVDVLWAGGAIGCGSLKDWKDNQPSNWTDVEVRGQRIVATGPLRTIVEVYDLGTSDGKGGRFDMRQRYTLCAHHRDLTVDVSLNGAREKTLCTGVQKVGATAADSVRQGHASTGFARDDGLAASWGCDYPDMGKKHIWAPQAIGMAAYVPQKHMEGTKEDDLNYLLLTRPDDEGKLRYYVTFCAAMEEDGAKTSAEWMAEVEDWMERMKTQVSITIK